MKTTRKKGSGLVWLSIFAVAIVVTAAIYFVPHLKNENKQPSTKKDVGLVQSEDEGQATNKEAATGTVIKVGDGQYGPMLFDNRGQAIYIWQLEGTSTAECYGNCAQEWPPVLTNGAPIASAGINSELLGTTKRTDGTMQVTYNGHPLYFYANEKPGEVECHNIRTHGGLWWVIQPNGNRAK